MSESDQKSTPVKQSISWPAVMQEMIEVIELSIDKEMERDASPRHLAESAVIAVCNVMGGNALYLPYGTTLELRIKRTALYKDFLDGMDHKSLVRKHKISSPNVYRIISDAQALNECGD